MQRWVRTSSRRTVTFFLVVTANRKRPSFGTYTWVMWTNGTWKRSWTIPSSRPPSTRRVRLPFPRTVRSRSPTDDCIEGKKGKGKGKQPTYVDADTLEAQWAKDRAKKAERKRERNEARLRAALDPDRGHTSRKAMRAAARLDPSTALSIAPRAIVDVASLEAQMRRFVEDVGGRSSMALPPMDKEARKWVHEVAEAFGVKSVSKGKGAARYTTLIKTRRTGAGVNEGKMRALVKRYVGRGGKGGRMPTHREGDEVGKEAPKIGESNIGFRMLASMGWSEGVGIGGTASVGIEAPLTAIIKTSKLGLGATR
jgi:hypothetical protein